MHQQLVTTRFTVRAVKVVETEIEADTLAQAEKMAQYMVLRDKVKLLSIEPCEVIAWEPPQL